MSVKGLKGHIKFLHCKWVQINRATKAWKILSSKEQSIFTTYSIL